MSTDEIESLLRLMHSDEHDPVNIGNPAENTIFLECGKGNLWQQQVAQTRLLFRPLPQDDPKQRCPDITRAKKILGWAPKISLAEGLQLSIPWIIENIWRTSGEPPSPATESYRPWLTSCRDIYAVALNGTWLRQGQLRASRPVSPSEVR